MDTLSSSDTFDSVQSSENGYPQGKISHHAVPQHVVVDKVQHPLLVFIRGGGLEVDMGGIPGIKEPILKLSLHQEYLEDRPWDLNYGKEIGEDVHQGMRVSLEYSR